ncbi:mitochondrial carrier domain-containing protein [Dunaliella salina]|uniref:Mitochondrial carrier domain-containing protein n=1 Tax=Dunaliella salina TaxID=3046 RepID=A0ABQ7H5V4_DUNSA|nr:mitochondrial carrier domain-containing protein [Dunaliella salina]|eukprot:KAF5842245.1 mitochondrial carrier domain-containing protein [Dunaliella salina]
MAKEHLGRYKNTLDCLQKVVQSEGVKALAIGLSPTLYRNCIWNSIFYGSMHEVEAHCLSELNNPVLSNLRSFCVGLSVGVFATCFNAPFDVVKSRMQSQLPGQCLYTTTLQALLKINREEGPRALWRGFVPKAIRLGVGQSIGLICFQNLIDSA